MTTLKAALEALTKDLFAALEDSIALHEVGNIDFYEANRAVWLPVAKQLLAKSRTFLAAVDAAEAAPADAEREECAMALSQCELLVKSHGTTETFNGDCKVNVGLLAQAIRLLRSAPSATPEGWKLVPIEPTVEMLEHGWNDSLRVYAGAEATRACWASMLAAAPKPEDR